MIDGATLTVSEIRALAAGGVALAISPAATERAVASREFADQMAAQRPIYGRSTGVGANRTVALDPAQRGAAAVALLRSHATSGGPVRAPERIRAMLAIRLNQLAAGGSGADPRLLEAVRVMLEQDRLPPVRELGSIGTGDLSALAITALTLIGELDPLARPDRPSPAQPPPAGPGLSFQISDALPFISSNAATIADAALALTALRELAAAAVVVAALSFVAVDGNAEAFSPAAERATPFPGASAVCRAVTALVRADGPRPAARIQDPFALRVLPQVHGALLDTLAALERVVELMANAPAENPVLSAEFGLAHHGGFHAASLAQALDAAALAAAQSGQISLARLSMLTEPGLTGLPPFLGGGTPGASGVMIVEYVVAAALAELRATATPASLQTVTLSRGVEEDASFASLAAVQLAQAAESYRTVLAGELVAAVRAIRLRGSTPRPAALGQLGPVLERLSGLSAEMSDRDLTADLATAAQLLGPLAEQAEL
ncbi:MAG: aromatic amino acid lyase [Frankiales bacterium]|nr:aromatic amino acid lyase [Frankiales bacterium]